MLVDDRDAFVAALRTEVGSGLRAVAEYDAEGYDAFYVRDDVASRLPEVAEELHHDLILQGIGRDHLEDLFQAGSLHCSMHRFDDLTAFHFVAAGASGDVAGLFVSIDTGADVRLDSFAETCESHL